MFNRIKLRLIHLWPGLLAGAFLQTTTGEADARSQSAILGNPANGSTIGCFEESFGSVRQRNCAGAAWVMPFVYDSSYNFTATVSARGAGSGTRNVTCSAGGRFQTGGAFSFSSVRTRFNTGQVEFLPVGGHAPSFGSTHIHCHMDQGTEILHVSY